MAEIKTDKNGLPKPVKGADVLRFVFIGWCMVLPLSSRICSSSERNVHKISNFSPKPWTNPFAKMPILWVFETDVFVVQEGLFAI